MRPIKLVVKTNSEKYPIIIGRNLISNLSRIFKKNSINFKKCLLVLDKNIPNIHLDICYTVGIFNIYYMEEILEWRDSFKSDLPIYFNHVYTPEHFSCKVLPESIKSNRNN